MCYNGNSGKDCVLGMSLTAKSFAKRCEANPTLSAIQSAAQQSLSIRCNSYTLAFLRVTHDSCTLSCLSIAFSRLRREVSGDIQDQVVRV